MSDLEEICIEWAEIYQMLDSSPDKNFKTWYDDHFSYSSDEISVKIVGASSV